MKTASSTLITTLDAVCELVQRSDFSLFACIPKEHALKALGDLKRQYLETGSMDALEASMLFAPTGGLEELSIENGWGHEFLELARDVDRILEQHGKQK